MKRLLVAAAMATLQFALVACQAQARPEKVARTLVEAAPLFITMGKTTNLLFPASIVSVDRGSSDILVQKARGVENILQVKAARTSFEESNLTVITSSGQLYSFPVRYAKAPVQLNINLETEVALGKAATVPPLKNNAEGFEKSFPLTSWLPQILESPETGFPKARTTGRVTLELNRVLIAGEVLFFRFGVDNRSAIDYEPEGFRFFIVDRKRQKRTAFQQAEIVPLENWSSDSRVRGSSVATCVVALPKFTLPARKYLHVEMKEKAGGRNLALKVHKGLLLNAERLDRPRQ